MSTAEHNTSKLTHRPDARIPGAQAIFHFDGPEYKPSLDQRRLTGQLLRIFSLMRDAKWRTLREIADSTGDPESSISAQIRHLRKPRFGSHTVNKRRRGAEESGLYEYQLIVRAKA